MNLRREFPGVNDPIIDRQRQIGGAVLVATEPQFPARPHPQPTGRGKVRVIKHNSAPVVEVVSRGTDRVAALERELVLAYNTPAENDDAFLAAARALADALSSESK